jgi:hypothetical protein
MVKTRRGKRKQSRRKQKRRGGGFLSTLKNKYAKYKTKQILEDDFENRPTVAGVETGAASRFLTSVEEPEANTLPLMYRGSRFWGFR